MNVENLESHSEKICTNCRKARSSNTELWIEKGGKIFCSSECLKANENTKLIRKNDGIYRPGKS